MGQGFLTNNKSGGQVVVVTLLGLLAVGCGDGRPTVNEQETSLDVTPRTALIVINSNNPTQQFKADLTGWTIGTSGFKSTTRTDVTSKVSWVSSDPSVATIDGSGLARAHKWGITTIKATYSSGDLPMTATATLTVRHVSPPRVQVTPAVSTLVPGGTQQLKATANFSDGTSEDISAQASWASADSAIATVNNKGLVTGIAAGATDITAGYKSVNGVASVVVIDRVAKIEVTPVAPTIAVGSSQQLKVTAIADSGLKTDVTSQVTWSSSDTAIAAVSSLGGVTAKAPGICQIRADLTVGGKTLSASTWVTVSSPPFVGLQVIGPAAVSGAAQYTATAVFAGGPSKPITGLVTWTSSDLTVAAFSASTPGQLQPTKSGTTTITAHYAGMASTPLTVTVSLPCTTLTITPSSAQTISVGQKITFTQSCPILASWAISDATVLGIVSTSTPGSYVATGLKAGSTQVFAQVGTITSNTVLVVVKP
jgi:hypothetical protein